jgi:hypothetical protein
VRSQPQTTQLPPQHRDRRNGASFSSAFSWEVLPISARSLQAREPSCQVPSRGGLEDTILACLPTEEKLPDNPAENPNDDFLLTLLPQPGTVIAKQGNNATASVLRGGRLAQLVRALARHAKGHWFESSIAHHTHNRRVSTAKNTGSQGKGLSGKPSPACSAR